MSGTTVRDRTWLITAVALIVAQAVILHLMGQPWIAASGIVKLWQGTAQSADNSQHIADWYSLSHVIHGFIFYGLLWLILPRHKRFAERLGIAVMIEVGWELVENSPWIIDRYRETTVSFDYRGDSVLNSVCDTLWMVAGFVLASRLPWRATLALAVAMEALAAWVIRDNLTLNVLMLIYPSDAVRAWQAGG